VRQAGFVTERLRKSGKKEAGGAPSKHFKKGGRILNGDLKVEKKTEDKEDTFVSGVRNQKNTISGPDCGYLIGNFLGQGKSGKPSPRMAGSLWDY